MALIILKPPQWQCKSKLSFNSHARHLYFCVVVITTPEELLVHFLDDSRHTSVQSLVTLEFIVYTHSMGKGASRCSASMSYNTDHETKPLNFPKFEMIRTLLSRSLYTFVDYTSTDSQTRACYPFLQSLPFEIHFHSIKLELSSLIGQCSSCFR